MSFLAGLLKPNFLLTLLSRRSPRAIQRVLERKFPIDERAVLNVGLINAIILDKHVSGDDVSAVFL